MTEKQTIMVGSGRGVGKVSVDTARIRGEGGPIRPQLVVPLVIEMAALPEQSSVMMTSLTARLASDQNISAQKLLCRPVDVSVQRGFHVRSTSTGSNECNVEVRFFLTTTDVEDIEQQRHASQAGGTLMLYLGLEADIAGIQTFNNLLPGQQPPEGSPWDSLDGLFSQLLPFWTTQITPLRVEIEQSAWIRNVLPGLGYERLRLIEMTFPPPLPDHTSAATQFDKARRALDERRYGDCILECRGLLNMWEKHYHADSKNHIAGVVAADRHWADDDIRRDFLDTLWKEVGDIANAPHHPEGDTNAELLNARDARLVLLLTAALSAYVEPG